jgi:hypothetical protein
MISAPATLLLGLEKFAGSPIAPGYPIELQYAAAISNKRPLVFKQDSEAGTLTCMLRLKLRGRIKPLTARLSTGHLLAVSTRQIDSSTQWLEIFEPAGDPAEREKFKWPSGIELIVAAVDGSPTHLELEDWEAFLEDKPHDSYVRTRWRRTWFWIWCALLAGALVGLVYGVVPERATREPLTVQGCLTQLINCVEGASGKETGWMQAVLRKVVLEGILVRDALDTIPLKPRERWQLWFKSRSRLLASLSRLLSDLAEVHRRLQAL